MTRFASKLLLLAGGALALAAPAAAQTNYVPNLQPGPGGWTHPFGGEFPPVQGSAIPVRQDPGHRFVNAVQSFRFGDISNPNLKQWAKDVMKKLKSDEFSLVFWRSWPGAHGRRSIAR